jgi:hypothetical protein
LDIEGAYRTIPCKPDHKRFLVVIFEGLFYMDHNIPFGLGSAAGLQGEVADCIIDLWNALKVDPAVKWVDDFDIFRFPSPNGKFYGTVDGVIYRYDYDLDSMKEMIAPLGVPWHKTKGSDFSDIFVYVGFTWDLTQKTVSLPEKKRIKYLNKLTIFLQKYEHAQVPKRELESVIGTLSHITFVFQHGRSFMSNLYEFLTDFKNDYIPRYMRSSVISDLKWWHAILSYTHLP